VLIEDKDDRMVYIANYILKNDYNSGDLLSVNEFTVSNINRANYELNNNVLVTRESWTSRINGIRENQKLNQYLNDRVKLQTTALFDQDEEIKDLKLQIKAESWKRDEMWAKAARNHKHNASLYAPDVSITINGVKYTEDEN